MSILSRLNLVRLSCLSAVCAAASSFAADSLSFEAATGDRTYIVRVGAQWDWNKKWFQSNGTHLGGYWDLAGAYWRENRHREIVGKKNSLYDIGFTPVFRFQRDDKRRWYVEGGIGVHYLSELYDNDGARLSTRFQFGDHLGIGYVFQNQLDVGLRLQHFSNGGFKEPNSGVDVAVLRLAYPF